MLFANQNQNGLGVDIGTKVIRAVELSGRKNRLMLENYGEVNLDVATKDFFRFFDRKTLAPAVSSISEALKALIGETGIKTKRVVFSLPDFITFYTTFELPLMPKKELSEAVGFEARKYIPLPLSELVLDWQLMNEGDSARKMNQILVMAIPAATVEQYKKIAADAGLELIALEAEAMALKRALVKKGDVSTICLLDIGFQSTNVSIVDKGFLRTSFSFDAAGKDLTFRLSEELNIPTTEAEEEKIKEGILDKGNVSLSQIFDPILSTISQKVSKIISDFENSKNRKITKVIIAGGTSLMPGLADYLKKSINEGREGSVIEVELSEPFSNIAYPPILQKKIEEIGPTYAIALGEALRKFE